MQMIMKAVVLAMALFTASAANSIGELTDVPATNIQGLAGVTEALLSFTASTTEPFIINGDGEAAVSGTCTFSLPAGVELPVGVSLPAPGACSLPIDSFESEKLNGGGNGKGGKGRQLISRELVTCNIINILIGVTNINILGLIVSLPQGLKLNVIGDPAAGLLGNLLCGLLGPNGLLSGLNFNLLQSIIGALNDLFTA